jgi:hypothetical protein
MARSLFGQAFTHRRDGVAVKYFTPKPSKPWGVVCMIAAAGLATFDSVRIFQAWRLIGTSAVWATVWGGLGISVTTAFIIWAGRHDAWRRETGAWRVYRLGARAWSVAFVVAFGLTHTRWSGRLTSNLDVGVTTYTAAFVGTLFFSGGLRMLRPHLTARMADPRLGMMSVSRNLLLPVADWQWPVHGLRHPQEGGTTGWYCWAGQWEDSDNFFVPLHASHLIEAWPPIAAHLLQPPGSRFVLSPDYVDEWQDDSLLDI